MLPVTPLPLLFLWRTSLRYSGTLQRSLWPSVKSSALPSGRWGLRIPARDVGSMHSQTHGHLCGVFPNVGAFLANERSDSIVMMNSLHKLEKTTAKCASGKFLEKSYFKRMFLLLLQLRAQTGMWCIGPSYLLVRCVGCLEAILTCYTCENLAELPVRDWWVTCGAVNRKRLYPARAVSTSIYCLPVKYTSPNSMIKVSH